MADLPQIRASARAYAQQAGLHLPETDYRRSFITEPASTAVAAGYNRMPSFQAGALPAYHAMREEVGRQFDHMTRPTSRGGLGLSVGVTSEDPYGKESIDTVFHDVRKDVRDRNHIDVLSSKTTGGHPFFSNDEIDMFRAVHDVYGHLASGRGVDHDGEEAAFQKHSRMFSPLARQAMATETRGQNSALRVSGDFPEQKVALLPQHLQGLQFARSGTAADVVKAVQRTRARNADQRL